MPVNTPPDNARKFKRMALTKSTLNFRQSVTCGLNDQDGLNGIHNLVFPSVT